MKRGILMRLTALILKFKEMKVITLKIDSMNDWKIESNKF